MPDSIKIVLNTTPIISIVAAAGNLEIVSNAIQQLEAKGIWLSP